MNPIMRVLALFGACAAAYQSYDALRSGITGTQSRGLASVENPKALSYRMVCIGLGVGCCGISFVLFLLAIFG
jgi:hypothetical protein